MSRNICLFGELDTYSNSIPQTIDALPYLIEQLKIACLIYDEVIVNTNVLLDHSLTLPAFQSLSCFTKSGVLWTSATEDQGQPEEFVLKRARKTYGDNLNEGISKNATERLTYVIEDWQKIAPSNWRVVRKIAHQQKNATSNIIENLKRLPFLSKQAIDTKAYLLNLVGYMQDQGMFNRNEIIARLGGKREEVTSEEFSQFALIVQGEYMNQGAHNKGNMHISLFSGRYIQYLKRHSHLFQAQPLPTDLDTIEKVDLRLHNSGFPLQKLIKLSQQDLCTLSQSYDWKVWRNYVISDHFSYESVKEMHSLHKIHQRLDRVLSVLLKNIDVPEEAKPTELLLPSPWVSAGFGLMGLASKTKKGDKSITLNLNSRKLKYRNKYIILDKSYVTLVSLFASTGNTGIPIETIKQLDIETDLIKRTFHNTWKPQKDEIEALDIARLNRINVTKNRLNKKLKALGIAIKNQKGKGLWKLVFLELEDDLKINIVGTPWEDEEEESYFYTAPDGLTKTQLVIWNYLIRRYSSFVAAKSIAIEIGAPQKSVKQISDIMYKFKSRIKESSFQLIKSYQGEYMLLRGKKE